MNATIPPGYDLRTIELQCLSGGKLRMLVSLLDSPLRHLVMPRLLREAGITRLRSQGFDEPPTHVPLHPGGTLESQAMSVPQDEWPEAAPNPETGFRFATVHDYASAYREGITSPDEVAARVWDAIVASNAANPPLRAVTEMNRDDLLRQAEAATKRIRSGHALGVFDGVPVGVKDEVDMIGYRTTAGTAFLGRQPATTDSTVVARMRAAGALLIGKTNMHEIGIGVTGLNPHHGTPRNPYAPERHTGGSSSGSAAAVAAGLCPMAIAADGGGSIRIPAALCGVVGLKPTYGRISEHGAVPLCWSVAHIGPIGATVTDTALGYAAMAGPDPNDPATWHQPRPSLTGWNKDDLQGVTLGVFWPWFRDADGEVAAICEAMLGRLREQGAKVREIIIPDLEAARVAHAITICTEMAQAMSATHTRHHRKHGNDVRINLRIARALTALDYIHAQRVRTRVIGNFRRVFGEVDAIMTPATATTAPMIPGKSLAAGVSDLNMATKLMRFATPANLAGLPAISFPAGYTATDGLPVGMQAIGRAWEESLLLRIARSGEACLGRLRPVRCFESLHRGSES
jgi:Asp-tRNA(Asn)/Glu-tRNA(Gln) amidotransferase A subunit family amidase